MRSTSSVIVLALASIGVLAATASAGCDSRAGRFLCPTKAFNHGANSGWLTNCHAPATQASR